MSESPSCTRIPFKPGGRGAERIPHAQGRSTAVPAGAKAPPAPDTTAALLRKYVERRRRADETAFVLLSERVARERGGR